MFYFFLVMSTLLGGLTLGKKATIHQLTTMLAISKYVLFPGPNHLLITHHFNYHPSIKCRVTSTGA